MNPAALAGFMGVGLAVGFTAGLVGIGGGVLMVPFLYFVYDNMAATLGPGWVVAGDLHATVAHATSLFVIVPTAAFGAWSYNRSGLVSWRTALPIGAFSVPGGILGANVAILLPAAVLKLAFGVFLLITAAQLTRERDRTVGRPLRLSLRVTIPIGIIVGIFSALLGVGGGLVAIPLMLYIVGLPIEKVAATSLAVIVFAASAGTVTYMIGGADHGGLPAGSMGYVHVIAGLPLMIGSLVTVGLGARVNQTMNVKTLRTVFAILLVLVGLRLVVQSFVQVGV
jgi:uncharacterized membrane protein YfcA